MQLSSFKEYKNEFWLVFITALVVFCQNAWVPGMFSDGYLYAVFGKNAAERGYWLIPHLTTETYNEFTQHLPFLFFLEGIFFKIFGASNTTARIFGASFSILSILALFLFLTNQGLKKWATMAAIACIIIPPFAKKSRHVNVDTSLGLFILLAVLAYYLWLQRDQLKFYILSIVFFGCAMLTKGPAAIIFPATIFFFLLFTQNYNVKVWVKTFCIFLFSLLIFGLWPLLLYFNDKFYIFNAWVNTTFFFSIIQGRDRSEIGLWIYPHFLLKYCAPWFLASIFGMYLSFKKKDKLGLLFTALFLGTIIPFSLVKLKYSNYLAPLYPAMSALAFFALKDIKINSFSRFQNVWKGLLICATLALLIFPLQNKTTRDPEYQTIVQLLKNSKMKFNWLLIDVTTPAIQVANLIGWERYEIVKQIKLEDLIKLHHQKSIEKNIIIIPKSLWESSSVTNPVLNQYYLPIFHFKKADALVLFEKTIITGNNFLISI